MSDTPAPSRVSLDEVRHVAELANLELTADELPRMAGDLDAMLGYVAQLNELQIADIAPMAQATEALAQSVAQHGESLRRDEVRPSLDRASFLPEAPEADSRFFKVPKVIER